MFFKVEKVKKDNYSSESFCRITLVDKSIRFIDIREGDDPRLLALDWLYDLSPNSVQGVLDYNNNEMTGCDEIGIADMVEIVYHNSK